MLRVGERECQLILLTLDVKQSCFFNQRQSGLLRGGQFSRLVILFIVNQRCPKVAMTLFADAADRIPPSLFERNGELDMGGVFQHSLLLRSD